MRTTKSQQDQSRRLIIRRAVDLMTEQGFEGTTMKQIARAANLGDATIYKYFPSKEKLVLAYFELAMADALVQMRETDGQLSFNLQERLQLLIDCVLETLLADREFVAVARKLIERSPLLLFSEQLPAKSLLKQAFNDHLEQAERAAEIAPCGFKPSLAGLMTDYTYAVVDYWLRDDSESFANTTQLVDLSLGVLVLALRSGLVDKLLELGGFMIRSQLARLMNNGSGLVDALQLLRRGLAGSGA